MSNVFKSTALNRIVDTKTAITILRIIIPLLMIYNHGFFKLTNVLGGNFGFLDPIGIGAAPSLILATLAEAICAFLVLIGFWTRGAALIVVLNMAVAMFFQDLPADGLPGIELPLLYLVGFLVILLLGPGKFSVDGMIRS